ncbi:polyribonucleotide nucleotidyltransferase, partial [Candidatus Woesebacteria bacterium RIFCSPHIGHO2_01_FULL_38_10]
FQRGQTQVLTVTTLGAPSLEQLIESAEGEETKKFIHHYSMPPFSTGETGRVGFPSRREIGHGALAERALIPVVPPEDKFPYTIRVVSETLSSNGSTSMASVCASTLSLMDAGVPITAPVSGIAMGLVIESAEKYSILTDIIGLEDFNGDMDFKVAGTKKGITALQLDVKTTNLTPKIIKEALEQAKLARLEILDAMLKVIDKHRESVSKYAPKIKVIKIAPEKIGELIGPGGRIIRKIIAETGVQIDVDDDGTIFVSSATEEELKIGLSRVEAITKDPQVGEVYEGVVRRLQPFGAFIEILPGKEGLVHVSDISEEFVKDPSDVLKVGDKVTVRIKGIDDLGRLNFSMVLDPSYDAKKEGIRREKSMRGDVRRGKPERRQTGFTRRLSGSKGPHFPTSRLLERDQTRHR